MNARVLKPVTQIYTHLHRVFIGSGPLNACCRGRCERSFRRKYLLIYFCKSYFTFFLTWCANVCSGSLLYIIFFAFVYYPSLYLSCKCTTFLWRMNCAPHSERVKKESFFFFWLFSTILSLLFILVPHLWCWNIHHPHLSAHLHQQRVRTPETYVAEFGKPEWLIHPALT